MKALIYEKALLARITELEALAETLKNEAQIHAMEARGASATINEINQFISGATGEPANWHGAHPVKDFVNDLKAQLADAKQVANDCRIVADNAIAEAKKNQWIPIETAPKDTEVLCRSKQGRIADAMQVTVNGGMSFWAWAYVDVEPTHWMPRHRPPS